MPEERKVFSVLGGEKESSSICSTCHGETHGSSRCPNCGMVLEGIVHHEFPGGEEKEMIPD